MSDEAGAPNALKAQLDSNDYRLKLEALCLQYGIKHTWHVAAGEQRLFLRIGIPNGPDVRWRTIATSSRAQDFYACEPSNIKALGDYDAFQFLDEGVIEAGLASVGDHTMRGPSILDLPGIEKLSEAPSPDEIDFAEDDGVAFPAPPSSKEEHWRLSFSAPDNMQWSVQLGTGSKRFSCLSDHPLPPRSSPRPSLRIAGIQTNRHDEALAILKKVSNAIFFELDLKYGVAVNLRRNRKLPFGYGRRLSMPEEGPRLPRNEYPDKALNLYWYARSANRMPLLQFLAYYQVLEYHFPQYSRRDTLDRLRQMLCDPLFEPEKDDDLARVLGLVGNKANNAIGGEQDQLRATIDACISGDVLLEYITASPEREKHFTGNSIKDIPKIQLKGDPPDIRSQIAKRIYELRCRIVHTKSDGSAKLTELLLPFTPEAESLHEDIDLVRLLAQKVLIASSRRLHL